MIDNKLEFLRQQVRRDFLLGKITGVSVIPTDPDVDKEVTRILSSSSKGIVGKLDSFSKNSVSDPVKYSDNFKTVKNNIEILLGDVATEVNEVIDQINNSAMEKNSAVRELRKISSSFSDVEAGAVSDSGISYSVSDSFDDTENIDLTRSTVDVHLNAGKVSLSPSRSNKLQFSHYLNQKVINFFISEGKGKVIREEQTPGSTFNAIFTSDVTDRWEYIVNTSEQVRLVGYFNLKLSETGEAIEINNVNLKLGANYSVDPDNPNGVIKIQYLDPADSEWKDAPGGVLEVSSAELNFDITIPAVSYIKIVFIKDWPDVVQNLKYVFSLTELSVKKLETVFESILMSKPLEITSYRREDISVHSASLTTEEKSQAGTAINYFVAVDDPIPGKVVNSAGDVVDIDSEDAVSFVPNGTNAKEQNENYYSYATQLRDHPWISGAQSFLNWEPNWQRIDPLNTRGAGNPTTAFFNVNIIKKDLHDLYFVDPFRWGDPRYTGPWPVPPTTSWTGSWSGGAGDAPKSGFIFGENPFTYAGTWWGDGIEMPGWWRPNVPDVSGMQTYGSDTLISTPDFSIATKNADGSVSESKDFWKIFRWPADVQPVEGTIKLSISDGRIINSSTESIGDKGAWKWNSRSKVEIKELTADFQVGEGLYHHTLKLEDYPEVGPVPTILRDSIRDLKFTDHSAPVDDYTIEHGIDFVKEGESFVRQVPEGIKTNSHCTLFMSDIIRGIHKVTGDMSPRMSCKLFYSNLEVTEPSWETSFFVPNNVPASSAWIGIRNYTGGITRVEIISLDEFGIPLDVKTYDAYTNMDKLPLSYGWVKVRVFVNISLKDITDETEAATALKTGTCALWSPNKYNIVMIDGTYMTGTSSVNDFDPSLTIRDETVDFIASGIVPGLLISGQVGDSRAICSGVVTFVTPTTITLQSLLLNGEIVDPTSKIYTYIIQDFNRPAMAAVYLGSVKPNEFDRSMKQVDPYTLLYETRIDDDSRFCTMTDADGTQYLVVKTPSKISPIVNKTHYTRSYFSGETNKYITFTTGSSGNTGEHPTPLDTAADLSDRASNTQVSVSYPEISTYGTTIQVTDPTSNGFLFWDTAENLQTYYKIEYAVAAGGRPSNRLLFMAKFLSDNVKNTPQLSRYTLTVNAKDGVI